MNNYNAMILMQPRKFLLDQEAPIDLAVICYLFGNFVGSILMTGCLAGGRCRFQIISMLKLNNVKKNSFQR